MLTSKLIASNVIFYENLNSQFEGMFLKNRKFAKKMESEQCQQMVF